jgi:hypothetical protein
MIFGFLGAVFASAALVKSGQFFKIIPIFGISRALSLYSKYHVKMNPSNFRNEARCHQTDTYRKEQLLSIERYVKESNGTYLILSGPPGIGKSHLLNTFEKKSSGVIRIKIPDGNSDNDILEETFNATTNLDNSTYIYKFKGEKERKKVAQFLKRILYFYQLFFGHYLTLIFDVIPKYKHPSFKTVVKLDELNEVISAAEYLMREFELRIIINSSFSPGDISLEKGAQILELREFSKDQIQNLPQLKDLMWKLNLVDDAKKSLSRLMWIVLGGVPADYIKLSELVNIQGADKKTILESVQNFICIQVNNVILTMREEIAKDNEFKELIDLFDKEKLQIRYEDLIVQNLTGLCTKKLFQIKVKDGVRVIVPRTRANALVLVKGLKSEVNFEQLKDILKEDKSDYFQINERE